MCEEIITFSLSNSSINGIPEYNGVPFFLSNYYPEGNGWDIPNYSIEDLSLIGIPEVWA